MLFTFGAEGALGRKPRSNWCGPGVIIAVQGRSAVFISYRGTVIKTTPELVRRATPSESLTFQEIMRELGSAQALLEGPGFAVEDLPIEVPQPFDAREFIDESDRHAPRGEDRKSVV